MGLFVMRRFIVLLLAAFISPALHAEAPCLADVKAIPFHSSSHHQMIVGVSINHSGPFDFLLDTGTQMTLVDRSLASELHLATSGNADVAGVSFQGDALFAKLDTLAVGDHVSTNQGVLVYNMKPVQAAGFAIRGLLGQDFLSQFDVLIDNSHGVLCLYDSDVMRGRQRGALALPALYPANSSSQPSQPSALSAHAMPTDPIVSPTEEVALLLSTEPLFKPEENSAAQPTSP
jgi:hypothetical protein